MNTQPIRFLHRGRIVEVGTARTTRTLLDWLREDAAATGTKEGCNEGDCGACTVVIGELADDGAEQAAGGAGRLALHPVNACIQFLPTLNGKAVFTVEDLKLIAGGRLHPVQQAMVDCHGSQCGFCTPGFVMSLWNTYERCQGAVATAAGDRRQPDGGGEGQRPAPPSRQRLADDLSGNLCRCTGYRPILDAGQRMFDLPAAPLDRRPVIDALAAIRPAAGFHYAAATSSSPAGASSPDLFHAPASLEELASLCQQHPTARLLGGGTDVGLWVNKQLRSLGDIIHLGNVSELKRIEVRDDELCIGAGASLEAAFAALDSHFAGLTDVWLRFASPPIRHAGTIGGNLANGSPIGDAAPVLMALDAIVELRRGDAVRQLPLDRFYLDYMRNDLAAGEFLQRVRVPLWPGAAVLDSNSGSNTNGNGDSEPGVRHLRVYKISKRFDSDISAVCAALAVHLDGDMVRSVRLAFGGMAAVVKRATQAEAVLAAGPWQRSTIDDAKAALQRDFEPLSDLRASAAYRMRVAQNLLQKFWLETRPAGALPHEASSVWSVMPHEPSARPPEGGLAPARRDGAERPGCTHDEPSARPPEGGLAPARRDGAERPGGTHEAKAAGT
jgi:xanthine dehydrogenase small subunit